MSGDLRIRRPQQASALVPVPPQPQGESAIVLTGWPRQDYLELAPLPGAVPCARLHTRQILWEWALSGLSESAELLVSELVTNAAKATYGRANAPVRLWLLADDIRLLILVWDATSHPPEPTDAAPDAESGRGLLLIEAISGDWAWYLTPETGGKVVWAAL